MKKVKKGFTLIELIVVIAILGILAVVLLPKFGGFTDKAKKSSVSSDARNIHVAIAAYETDKGKYPSNTAEILKDKDALKSISEIVEGINETTGVGTNKKTFAITSDGFTLEDKSKGFKATVDKKGKITQWDAVTVE